MSGTRAAAAAVLLACALSDRNAHAQAPSRIDYTAAAGCPDADAFVAQIRARTERLQAAKPGEAAPVYRIQVAAAPSGARGTLTVVEPSGAVSSREVEGDTCDSVVDALALIVALALDPNASTAPLPPSPAPLPAAPAPLPASPAPVAAAAPSVPNPAASPPPTQPTPSVTAPTAVVQDDARAGARARSSGWEGHIAATAGADLTSGLTSSLLVGPVLSVEATWPWPWSRRTSGPILDIRLGVTRASSTVPASVGSAKFTWTLGRLETCPLVAHFGNLEALPCARFDGGELQAVGAGVDTPLSRSRLWLSLGLIGRLRWTPLAPIILEIDAGLSAPLLRDHFYFDAPQTAIYDVPALAATAGATAGGRFW